MLIPILIAVIVGGALLLVLLTRGSSKSSKSDSKKKGKTKSQSTIEKECTKKLSKNPRDISALKTLSEIYYTNKSWEEALPLYTTMCDLAASHPEIDQNIAGLRQGICLLNTGKKEEALKALALAYKNSPNGFEQNYYMGLALYYIDDYEKAIACLKKANVISPEAHEINEPLGLSLFKAKKYRECLPYLRNVLNEQPENKEVLFDMASAMNEAGMGDKALKVFMHLRPDPTFGPLSCLEAGKMHLAQRQYDTAIQTFEIGLKIQGAPTDVRVQLRYNLAVTYISTNNIAKALSQLTQIQAVMANYKDVDALVARYSELNQNSNLQTYLLAGQSEFAALCRKFVTTFYKSAFVKIQDVKISQEHVEIICEVDTPKWEDTELFRFYRTQGAIGELYVRDFHTKLRDSKCDRGFIITAGLFSGEGKKYAEGRPIDLIEKNKLVAVLQKIEA